MSETVEFECKLAHDPDGKGEVPKDFWPTCSAMANAHGGIELLGVREKNGHFSIAGLDNPTKVRSDLFNTLYNKAKVSTKLLCDADANEIRIDEKSILQIRIPAATRHQGPVYLNGNPFGNTYRRLNDGDRHCDEETVKRLLAEQVNDSRDTGILYFEAHRPDHPWQVESGEAFLSNIAVLNFRRFVPTPVGNTPA